MSTLFTAQQRGVITTEQLDTLLASAGLVRDASPERAMDRLATGRTTPLGLAYRLGAALVLLSAGWLLAEQWERLGPAGVTLVSGGYLVVTVLASRAFEARGAHRAAEWMATLAVALTPLVTWAALWWSGWWPETLGRGGVPGDELRGGRPLLLRVLVVETVTVVASVLARRAHANVVHTALLMGSVTTLAFTAWVYAWNTMVTWPSLEALIGCWGGILVLVGYGVDRQDAERRAPSPHPDVWYAGGVLAWAACVAVHWQWFGPARHVVLPLTAAAWLWTAVQLGRRTFATAGMAAAVVYLLWLLGDVLLAVLAGPAALLGLGMLILLLAVWAQRRFPTVMQRWVRWRVDAALSLPGTWTTAAVPLAAALVLAAFRGRVAP